MLCVIYNLLSFCSIYLLSFRRFLHCCKAFPFYVNIYFRFRIWSSTKQSQITHDSKYNKGKFSERLCTTKILFESNCGFPNFFPQHFNFTIIYLFSTLYFKRFLSVIFIWMSLLLFQRIFWQMTWRRSDWVLAEIGYRSLTPTTSQKINLTHSWSTTTEES